MKIKHVGAAFLASLAFLANSAFATAYVACDGCNATQMNAAAVANGVGLVVVGSVTTNTAQKYRVYLSNTGPQIAQGHQGSTAQTVGSTVYADLMTMTAQETAAFASFVSFYNTAPVGYQKNLTLQIVPASETLDERAGTNTPAKFSASFAKPMGTPVNGGGKVHYPDPSANVYSVINSGPNQNALTDWASTLTTFNVEPMFNQAAQIASTYLIANSSNLPAVNLTVIFVDGSHIGVYVDYSTQPPQIVVNPNTGVDSHGNNVPATKQTIGGPVVGGKQNYNFGGSGNPTDRPNMQMQISQLSGTIAPSGLFYYCIGSTGPNGAVIVSCYESQ